MLYESESELLDIKKAIQFVKDYIDLSKHSLPGNIKVEFEESLSSSPLKIPPLLFTPMIENTFKVIE